MFRNKEMKKAYEHGGYRERYAMEHGEKVTVFQNGKEFWKFSYSTDDEYQDANGSTWCITERRWVQ